MNWHKSSIHVSFFNKVCKHLQLSGLIPPIHGKIWRIPLTQDTKPTKFLFLYIYPFSSKLATLFSDFDFNSVIFKFLCSFMEVFKFFVLLHYLHFYRHTMVIPTRNVRCIIPFEAFIFHKYIFKNFIQSSAQMDMPIGVRGTVMKNENGAVFPFFKIFKINPILFPPLYSLRFLLFKICFH